ncbi:MAG: mannanase [Sphingomonas bacterium]|uniref:glycoside hydrolase 5 family protein n=1 Tax=Sphingomonas bacterium TaxID=1895847 RepID=UPI00260E6712|nr:cellulase family glycosylhydrolase [Sphingomonas bacterium]MDB5704730.1 mannanase [Sphingomonas bacterium]
MFTRRDVVGAGVAMAAVPAFAAPTPDKFVRREGMRFTIEAKPYRYAGANIWYGAWLGADAPYGDRDRLRRELDALAALGVTNLRVLASSEKSPLLRAVEPAMHDGRGHYDPALLGGLDFLLAEMAKRHMRAVLYLTNFWEWSGGMMTYLSYVDHGRYINMGDPAHPWPEFPDYVAKFYGRPDAVALYRAHIRAIVGRTNRVTGTAYASDPTIMAWQLANEPRPGGSDAVGLKALPAFHAWTQSSAKLIKALAPRQLVSTGSEGLKGSLERAEIVKTTHALPEIDYLTCHVWPLNWGWIDAANLAATEESGAAKVADYVDQHIRIAKDLGKPLVIEEFGYPRDGGSYDPAATTAFKDRYYRQIYGAVEADVKRGGPIAGSNFWAWSGEGRAAHADHRFLPGDKSWLGDPPHEPQGWYGVFGSDDSTKAVIRDHAAAIATPVA